MPRVAATTVIHAPRERVGALYRDYRNWPRLFPATIRGVRLVRAEGRRVELEMDHREGLVPNVMTDVGPERVDLWERKRRYSGSFVNRFEPVPEGTRYTVEADIRLRGSARLLAPLLGGVIRRRLKRYVLGPVRAAAERAG